MADKDASGGIMPAAELKPLLHLARRQPLSCALAMTKDKQGLVLLHRRTKPRKLLAELKRQAKSGGVDLVPSTARFGRAATDGGSDSSTVTFTVNKAAPGPMHVAMLAKVRPAGFPRCEIVVDENLETEPDEDEAVEQAAAPQAQDPAPAQATPPPAPAAAETSGAPPAAAPPQPQAAPQATRHGMGHPVFDKGRQTWEAVRVKLQGDIDAALKGMADIYGDDDPRAKTIRERVEPIMQQLDDSLATKLGEVAANTAPDAHAGLVREAEAIIGRYKSFVDGEPMIAGLDQNPFHPVTLRETLDTALATLGKVVASA